MRSEGYCSCPVYVCMYACVCPLITAASHIGITKERYQLILCNTGIVLNFADFPKNASFKSYGVLSMQNMLEQDPDFWCWFDTTQFSYHCVHPIQFSIQMSISQIVPKVCTLVLFILFLFYFVHFIYSHFWGN